MQNKWFIVITILLSTMTRAEARSLDDSLQNALNSHYTSYKDKEYFSGITLSIYKPHQPIKNFYAGKTSHKTDSSNIDASTLFDIGSITKSFTAAIILQLEKEGKIKLTDTLQQWLPEYNKWSTVTIESLLNMTSGLPNYSDAPLMNYESYKHMQQHFRDKDLITFVYPRADFTPPLRPGYNYTNTGYILSGMIIEKITEHSFQHEIQSRLIEKAELQNTFYPVPELPTEISARIAHGYSFNPYSNPEILGKDMRDANLSWAGAAGAVISTSADIIKWTKALFIDTKILDTQQKIKLTRLVSTETGKPIAKTSSKDPRGFGLGVSEAYQPGVGRYWFYEGETEGFRALFMYIPETGIIISAIFNSAVNHENDHAGELMNKIYTLVNSNQK